MNHVYALAVPFLQGVFFMWGCVVTAVSLNWAHEKYLNKENKKHDSK